MVASPQASIALDQSAAAPWRYKDKSVQASSALTSRRVGAPTSRWRRQALTARNDAYFPNHVRACANNNLEGDPWFLAVWRKSDPSTQTRVPYTCGSYRCPSEGCQRYAAHSDFARISEALEKAKTDGKTWQGWVFFVLTIDQRGTLGEKHFDDEQHAFRELSKMTAAFMQRLRRHQEQSGWRRTGNEWVATVEIQRNGWPHMNIMVYAPELAAHLRDGERSLGELGVDERGRRLVRGRVREMVRDSRWGDISTAEACRSVEALAGYIVKLGGDLGRTAGEIAKLTQSPTNARMKLRRIRAGKHFLPPRRKDPEWTGIMLKHTRIFGQTVPDTLMRPDMVKPRSCGPEPERCEGETVQDFARRHAAWVRRAHEELKLYVAGVGIALEAERDHIAKGRRVVRPKVIGFEEEYYHAGARPPPPTSAPQGAGNPRKAFASSVDSSLQLVTWGETSGSMGDNHRGVDAGCA